MFKKKNSLPRPELHLPVGNRQHLARTRQHRANVRSAVVASLSCVNEISRIFRHQPLEKHLQVFACGRIGIFHYDQTAASVLHKHRGDPCCYSAFRHGRLDLDGDLIGPFAFRSKLKAFGISLHAWLNATQRPGPSQCSLPLFRSGKRSHCDRIGPTDNRERPSWRRWRPAVTWRLCAEKALVAAMPASKCISFSKANPRPNGIRDCHVCDGLGLISKRDCLQTDTI
jgi:hypothetical protein